MKKFLALLLAALMSVAALAGCGGDKEEPAGTETAENAETEEKAEETEEKAEETEEKAEETEEKAEDDKKAE